MRNWFQVVQGPNGKWTRWIWVGTAVSLYWICSSLLSYWLTVRYHYPGSVIASMVCSHMVAPSLTQSKVFIFINSVEVGACWADWATSSLAHVQQLNAVSLQGNGIIHESGSLIVNFHPMIVLSSNHKRIHVLDEVPWIRHRRGDSLKVRYHFWLLSSSPLVGTDSWG